MGKELLNRNKMASIDDRQKQVEDKKQELLRRIAEKKKIDKGKPPPLPPSSDGNTPTASRAGPMFLNDGNFLARFQAMQQQSTSSPSTSTATITGPETRPTVSMKLTTVKKSTPVKPVSARPEVFEDPEEVEENVPPPEDKEMLDVIEVLAARVVRGGDQVERIAIQDNSNNPNYSFLFDVNSQGHKYYKNLVRCLRSAGQGASKGVDSEHSASTGMQKRKRKSRWDPNPPKSAGSSSSSNSDAAVAAALAVAAEIEHSIPMSNKEEEERQKQIKEQQEIQEMYMRILAQRTAGQASAAIKRDEDKPKYEYDSDEDIDGGTWEHKRRKKEMSKTIEKAKELTDKGKGKHHLGDFLPPEELKKFTAKVKAVKGESSLDSFDFSDYAEHKITESNIGYKMLQQAGWKEGMGLGSQGQGITAPVNRGRAPEDIGGLGEDKPGEINRDDDEFDLYRKRMMLAYRFRPNPLNNPRRPYY